MKRFLLATSAAWALAPTLALASPPPIPPPSAQPQATNAQVTNLLSSQNYGDSLTAATNSQVPYTVPFQATSGLQTNNGGIGGQWGNQIMGRYGTYPTTLSFTSNQLVTGSNSVTAMNGGSIVSMSTNSGAPQPLSTSADDATRSMTGTVCGIAGTLTRTASGGPPSTSETYTFTPSGSIATTPCAANSTFTPSETANWNQPAVWWIGRNGVTFGDCSNIISEYQQAVAAKGDANYLIADIINAENEPSGSAAYIAITGCNTTLAADFPGHFALVREALVAAYNPANAVDVIDHGNDVPPYSLHTVYNGTLSGSLSNVATSFTVGSGTVPQNGSTVLMGTEYMLVTGVAGSVVTVTRGYAGSTATSYTNGQAFTSNDVLHLNTAGYAVVAATDYANIKALQSTVQNTTTASNAFLLGGYQNIYAGNLTVGTQHWSTYGSLPTITPFSPTNGGGFECDAQTTGQFVSRCIIGTSFLFSLGGSNQLFEVVAPNNQSNSPSSISLLFQNLNLSTASTTSFKLVNQSSFNAPTGIGSATLNNANLILANGGGVLDQNYTYSQPTTGSTVTIPDTQDFYIIDPTGSLSTLTVNLPTCSAVFDGKIAGFSSSQTVTTLTVGATAGSISTGAAPATLTAGQTASFICHGANTTWFAHR